MFSNIPMGHLIGSTIEHGLWFLGGAYLAWIRPSRIQRDVLSGKFSSEEGKQKLKKRSPLLGYLVMITAIAFTLSDFFR